MGQGRIVQTSLAHEKQRRNIATFGAKPYLPVPLETWEYHSQESMKTFPRTIRDLGEIRSRRQRKAEEGRARQAGRPFPSFREQRPERWVPFQGGSKFYWIP